MRGGCFTSTRQCRGVRPMTTLPLSRPSCHPPDGLVASAGCGPPPTESSRRTPPSPAGVRVAADHPARPAQPTTLEAPTERRPRTPGRSSARRVEGATCGSKQLPHFHASYRSLLDSRGQDAQRRPSPFQGRDAVIASGDFGLLAFRPALLQNGSLVVTLCTEIFGYRRTRVATRRRRPRQRNRTLISEPRDRSTSSACRSRTTRMAGVLARLALRGQFRQEHHAVDTCHCCSAGRGCIRRGRGLQRRRLLEGPCDIHSKRR
jgi:hypothetical protein